MNTSLDARGALCPTHGGKLIFIDQREKHKDSSQTTTGSWVSSADQQPSKDKQSAAQGSSSAQPAAQRPSQCCSSSQQLRQRFGESQRSKQQPRALLPSPPLQHNRAASPPQHRPEMEPTWQPAHRSAPNKGTLSPLPHHHQAGGPQPAARASP